ncbi:hypothetical protein CHL78_007880 [Romboutsia weinsteinii]|uniref:Integrase SAM-like N-terminal domain-containing protein n=1 Tax=Romboutsia weinsteinii TaxID=2020949 RepID=A0A371J5F1_9FIRM|nr:hypothetical protein CHL78_007880 [Romboutsia weinsteinii]
MDLGIIAVKRKRISKSGFLTKKDCEVAQVQTLVNYNLRGIVRKDCNITFSDYLDILYEQYVLNNCAYRTQKNYESIIRVHIKPLLGMYRLNNITTSILQSFFLEKYKKIIELY